MSIRRDKLASRSPNPRARLTHPAVVSVPTGRWHAWLPGLRNVLMQLVMGDRCQRRSVVLYADAALAEAILCVAVIRDPFILIGGLN